jgi:DNA-binding transcriptional ArsR family regulator
VAAAMEKIFKALADPTRVAVIESLALGDKAVGELAQPFDMALPSFMQHLKVLEEAGLIRTRKEGRTRQCHLEAGTLKSAEAWLNTQHRIWSTRLDQLDAYLISMEETKK